MSFESQISNYYEKLIVDELTARGSRHTFNDDALIDIACVALNQLPARYYRYSVDMAFYLSAKETQQMEGEVKEALDYAVKFVQEHKGRS